ncbi:MAG: mug [Firmicutes bacterium]|nr:mug [Bacillota bacterium]
METVRDIIGPGLKILFIGFNPGTRSAQTGYHFAGHSNKFWKLLLASKLTPRLLRPDEDEALLAFDYGITNIVARPTRAASEISKDEYRKGRLILKEKLIFFSPRIACYTGIGVYKEFSASPQISCGLQPTSTIPNIADFVVPSPSGLNRISFDEQLAFYQRLRELAQTTQ